MSDSDKLSLQEQQELNECLAVIKQGPPTAKAIGPTIDRIDRGRLYRSVANLETFLDINGLDGEEGSRLLEEWRQTSGRPDTHGQQGPEHPGQAGDQANPAPTSLMATTAPATPSQAPTSNGTGHEEQTAKEDNQGRNIPQVVANPKQGLEPTTGSSTAALDKNVGIVVMGCAPSAEPHSDKDKPAPNTQTEAPRLLAKNRQEQTRKKTVTAASKSEPGDQKKSVQAEIPASEVGTASTNPSTAPSGTGPSNTRTMKLQLSDIKVDPGVQSRVRVDNATIKKYAERMKAGDRFPRLDVFDVNGAMLLADGFQRHAAAQLAGIESVEIVVHRGSRRDAIKFGIEAKPRTNDAQCG